MRSSFTKISKQKINKFDGIILNFHFDSIKKVRIFNFILNVLLLVNFFFTFFPIIFPINVLPLDFWHDNKVLCVNILIVNYIINIL